MATKQRVTLAMVIATIAASTVTGCGARAEISGSEDWAAGVAVGGNGGAGGSAGQGGGGAGGGVGGGGGSAGQGGGGAGGVGVGGAEASGDATDGAIDTSAEFDGGGAGGSGGTDDGGTDDVSLGGTDGAAGVGGGAGTDADGSNAEAGDAQGVEAGHCYPKCIEDIFRDCDVKGQACTYTSSYPASYCFANGIKETRMCGSGGCTTNRTRTDGNTFCVSVVDMWNPRRFVYLDQNGKEIARREQSGSDEVAVCGSERIAYRIDVPACDGYSYLTKCTQTNDCIKPF